MIALLLLALASDWPKHVVAEQFRTNTAIAADFTGDGRVDVIANDSISKQDVLFVAPDWRRVALHKGASSIYSAAFDVDGDGDTDYRADAISGVVYGEEWLDSAGRVIKRVVFKGTRAVSGDLDTNQDGVLDTRQFFDAIGEIERTEPLAAAK